MDRNYTCTISYGKLRIPVYRVYAHSLVGINPIPESAFTARANTLFALEVDVEVFGNNFLPAYTEGDNSQVVATDSMKNFVLRQALAFTGSTLEDLLAWLGKRFLTTYEQMQSLRLTARELPFAPVALPGNAVDTLPQASQVLFSRSHNAFAQASMTFARDEQQKPGITSHRCSLVDLELFKVTGSAFTRFVRDEYTTLPEREDRPLFIHLDVSWTYKESTALTSADHALYVPAEQVRDLIQVVFDEFVSESIQHLVYEFGCRLLERFPQLASVTFDAQNRTRDLVVAAENNGKEKVYSDPFTAFGSIRLTLANPHVSENGS
ncbi:MAG TPA: urate oxidase [Ktedonobacteraceae bacterium]|jgi:urate oxidase